MSFTIGQQTPPQRRPSFNELLAESAAQTISERLKSFNEEKQRKAKAYDKFESAFGQYQRNYDLKDIEADEKRKIAKTAKQLIDEGMELGDAIELSAQKWLKQSESEMPQQPSFSAGEGASALAGGFAGGAGGGVQDLLDIAASIGPGKSKALPQGGILTQLADFTRGKGLKGTEELTEEITEKLGGTPPHSSAGKILQRGGQWGGLGAVAGAGGGPVPAAIGAGLGFATGVVYEGLQEFGLPEYLAFPLALLTGHSKDAAASIMKAAKSSKFKKPSGPQPKVNQTEAEEIGKKALERLKGRNITLEQVESGDPKAAKALVEETEKAGNAFKKAEKFDQKKKEAVRKETSKKLEKTPVEKYYYEEPPKQKRPDTIAKEKLRSEQIKPKIENAQREARAHQRAIFEAEDALKYGDHSPQAKARIESNLELSRRGHAEAMQKIRDLRFADKYGKPPSTLEQIGDQIKKTFSELVDAIKKPGNKKVDEYKRHFEKDKQLIQEAEELSKRGDLPTKEVMDEYMKIRSQYNKAYGQLESELKDFIKDNRNAKGMGAKVKRAEDLLDTVKNTRKLNEARVAVQRDKRMAKSILDKPSGAFYRQELRKAGREIQGFEKDFFKWKDIASEAEKKVATQAQSKIPKNLEPRIKEGVEAAKNPSAKNIGKAAEATGTSSSEVKGLINRLKKTVNELNNPQSLPGAEKKAVDIVKDFYNKMPKRGLRIANGVLIGLVTGVVEDVTGWRPKQGLAAAGLGGLTSNKWGWRFGTAGIAGTVHNLYRNASDEIKASHLRKLRNNPKEYNKYLKHIENKYSKSRANTVRKKALSK